MENCWPRAEGSEPLLHGPLLRPRDVGPFERQLEELDRRFVALGGTGDGVPSFHRERRRTRRVTFRPSKP